MPESNHHVLTVFAKSGQMMKAIVQAVHHPEEIKPNAANALGILFDLNHRFFTYQF